MYLFRFLILFFTLAVSSFAFADPNPPPAPPADKPPATGETDATRLAAALRREEEYKAEIAKLKNPPKEPDPKDPGDLGDQARRAREEAEAGAVKTKNIERAVAFNMGIDAFVKDNAELLPETIAEVVKIAHQESYDNQTSKANAIKSSLIKEFFAIQKNLESLTIAQKSALDTYLKLSKTAREEKSPEIFENIFEPAIDQARKVKKAMELGRQRAGYANQSNGNLAYKDRLVANAKQTHLGERPEAK